MKSLIGSDSKEGDTIILQKHGNFEFAPLINEKLNLTASLKITLLRPEPPGSIITQGGDIDNRLKTLFDALKVPSEPCAIPSKDKPLENETPFFCVLEDDNLITHVSVETDRLLEPTQSQSKVLLLIHVHTKRTRLSWANMGV